MSYRVAKRRPVPPPRSLYRKIQLVLAEARRGEVNSIDELGERVYSRGHFDFTYFVTGAKVVPSKAKSIKRIVRICQRLGFIKMSTGEVTTSGLKATSPDEYDRELRNAIKRVLKELGAPIEDIRKGILDVLIRHKGKKVPSWDVIYNELDLSKNGLARVDFHMYLNLLAAANGIGYCQRKIYLTE